MTTPTTAAPSAAVSRPPAAFYRFDDVTRLWKSGLKDEKQKQALQEFLSRKSLTEGHPLNNGKQGIELWVGTKASGVEALLFSAPQVQYIADHLHVPLPSSSRHLLPSHKFSTPPVPRFFPSLEDLKAMIKAITSHNKTIKNASSQVTWVAEFEATQMAWRRGAQFGEGAWLAIDFEHWERDTHSIIEVGWSVLAWEKFEGTQEQLSEAHVGFLATSGGGNATTSSSDQAPPVRFVPRLRAHHFCPSEHMSKRNGRWVADHKDHFLFGETIYTPLEDICGRLQQAIDELRRRPVPSNSHGLAEESGARATGDPSPVYVVFHDKRGDLKSLESMGIDINDWVHNITLAARNEDEEKATDPTTTARKRTLGKVHILDTSKLFATIEGRSANGNTASLKNMCASLRVGSLVDPADPPLWTDAPEKPEEVEARMWKGNGNMVDGLASLHNAGNDAHLTLLALHAMVSGPPLLVQRQERFGEPAPPSQRA